MVLCTNLFAFPDKLFVVDVRFLVVIIIVIIIRLVGSFVHPTARHFHGLGPLRIHASASLFIDSGVKGGAIGAVHVLEVREVFPNTDGESSSNSGTEGGSFVHGGTFNGDLNDIGLGLTERKVS